MRRSSHVFAPLLAAAAIAPLSGCPQVKRPHNAVGAQAEASGETKRGGFGESFENHPVIWWFMAAGAIVVAGRFVSPGE